MVALMKATAVCPEGNEFCLDPSGRVTFVVYFRVLTAVATKAAEKASETSMRPQELRPSTPAAFSPNMAAAGTRVR